jgi:polygalacturonase
MAVIEYLKIKIPDGFLLSDIPFASLDYKRFGAAMDNIKDDTAAVQAAIDDYARKIRQSSDEEVR